MTQYSGIWTGTQQLQAKAQGNWPAPAAAPYTIDQSVKFNSGASTYMYYNQSAGSPGEWTWSGWIKRSKLGSNQHIYGIVDAPGGYNRQTYFKFDSNDKLDFTIYDSSYISHLVTTMVFRDTSSWYHIVVKVNTPAATASDRVKIYVNGNVVTAFDTETYPTTGYATYVNNGSYIGVGLGSNYPFTAGNFFDGYMAEVNFIDGYEVPASGFGEYNATTGVWQPKPVTVWNRPGEGVNGSYLKFASFGTAAALGTDSSGGGNDWTPVNMSVSAGSTYSPSKDSPTTYPISSDTGLGGEIQGNYATWNPLRTAATLTNGGLDITGPSNGVNSFATFGVSSGKWYWEVTIGSVQNTYYPGIGVNTDLSLATSSQSGADALGYMYLASGQKFNSNSLSSYGASFTTNDVIGVALDMDAGTLTFYKNGSTQGQAFSGITGTAVPVVISWTSSTCFSNFGQRPFSYQAPSGFKVLCTQNLTEPAIVQSNDVFNTVLYTSTGSTQAVTGVGFQPEFVWMKSRSAARYHWLVDVVRGTGRILFSNGTDAEGAYAGILSTFNTDGFTTNSNTNASESMVAWNWKAGGPGVTNTDGSITSTVSANQTTGLSVVKYTGNGTGGATVGHGLGVSPSVVITKSTTNAATYWLTLHTSAGLTGDTSYGYPEYYMLLLNTNGAKQNYSSDLILNPTASTFTLGDAGSGWSNATGYGYVAYCFAPVEGFSAMGKYVGNGSTNGPFLYTGFRPAFVMIKNIDATGSWVILDDKRNTYNVASLILQPNAADAEITDTYSATDFCSNGFKVRGPGTYGMNASGETYVYMAFAANPFKYALAR